MMEQIVTTIATVADAVEEHFVPYYDFFMPSLKYVMAQATAKEYRLLRGKTIECISLIGLAVGQDKVRGVWLTWGHGQVVIYDLYVVQARCTRGDGYARQSAKRARRDGDRRSSGRYHVTTIT